MNVDKEAYQRFCEKNLAPIFSQPWWMDAICGEDAWDVWLCRHGDEIVAAMPYYMEAVSYTHLTLPTTAIV